jgi:hypothetical protein
MTASTIAADTPVTTDALVVDYDTDPSRYRHWRLEFDGPTVDWSRATN